MALEPDSLGLNPHLLTLGKPLYLCVPAEVTGEGPNGVSSSLGRRKGDCCWVAVARAPAWG